MARRIEIGTELTGQDAIDFIEYMKNPTDNRTIKRDHEKDHP